MAYRSLLLLRAKFGMIACTSDGPGPRDSVDDGPANFAEQDPLLQRESLTRLSSEQLGRYNVIEQRRGVVTASLYSLRPSADSTLSNGGDITVQPPLNGASTFRNERLLRSESGKLSWYGRTAGREATLQMDYAEFPPDGR